MHRYHLSSSPGDILFGVDVPQQHHRRHTVLRHGRYNINIVECVKISQTHWFVVYRQEISLWLLCTVWVCIICSSVSCMLSAWTQAVWWCDYDLSLPLRLCRWRGSATTCSPSTQHMVSLLIRCLQTLGILYQVCMFYCIVYITYTYTHVYIVWHLYAVVYMCVCVCVLCVCACVCVYVCICVCVCVCVWVHALAILMTALWILHLFPPCFSLCILLCKKPQYKHCLQYLQNWVA